MQKVPLIETLTTPGGDSVNEMDLSESDVSSLNTYEQVMMDDENRRLYSSKIF